ncbi:MAG: DUF1320 family protein [Magnetococcales bacterium]|nr:DUF1320 family protein [Magnetococcales bacterium]
MYVTPANLLEMYGAAEMAGISRPDDIAADIRVTGELLRVTASAGDRSAWSAEEREAADRCLARIEAAIGQASMRIDSHLSRRYVLPLSAGMVAANPLKQICGDLVRWMLDDDTVQDATKARYQDALRWLDQVQRGEALLAPETTSPSGGAGGIATIPGATFFRAGGF